MSFLIVFYLKCENDDRTKCIWQERHKKSTKEGSLVWGPCLLLFVCKGNVVSLHATILYRGVELHSFSPFAKWRQMVSVMSLLL